MERESDKCQSFPILCKNTLSKSTEKRSGYWKTEIGEVSSNKLKFLLEIRFGLSAFKSNFKS